MPAYHCQTETPLSPEPCPSQWLHLQTILFPARPAFGQESGPLRTADLPVAKRSQAQGSGGRFSASVCVPHSQGCVAEAVYFGYGSWPRAGTNSTRTGDKYRSGKNLI